MCGRSVWQLIKREVEGEPGDDERQGADPWDLLLGHERSRVRGATSWGCRGWMDLETWDVGMRERRGWGTPNIEPPTHENQMKGRLDYSLGLREEEREKKGAHKAVRVRLHLSIMAQCAPAVWLRVLVLMNVSITNQHVYFITVDVFNLGLTQSLTSYVSSLLTAQVERLWEEYIEKEVENKRVLLLCKMQLNTSL